MPDIVNTATRSRMMAGIRSKNTAPELLVRQKLHRLGFRFRLHDRRLPGKPDLLLPKYEAAIFINGCFWHGHDCPAFRWPKTNAQFWRSKIERNRENDKVRIKALFAMGWRVCVIWECSIKKYGAGDSAAQIAQWLSGTSRTLEIS